MKRTAGLLLVCVLVFAQAVTAFAETYTNGRFQYTVEDHSVTITLYFGDSEEVEVPNMIAGEPVNVIATGAFSRNDAVRIVKLPDTVMTVETGAFSASQQVVYDYNLQEETPAAGTTATAAESSSVPEITSNVNDTVKETVPAETVQSTVTSQSTVTTQDAGVIVVNDDVEAIEISDSTEEKTTEKAGTTTNSKSDAAELPETIDEDSAGTVISEKSTAAEESPQSETKSDAPAALTESSSFNFVPIIIAAAVVIVGASIVVIVLKKKGK